MRRFAPTALVVCLLAATAVAFAFTEHLKLEPSPVYGTRVTALFSPRTGHSAQIAFRLRKRERVSVSIIDANGTEVAQIVSAKFGPGRLAFAWDGRDRGGMTAADGVYRVRVRLGGRDRSLVFPNRTRLDATPPKIKLLAVRPAVFSPDGDGRSDHVRVTYEVNEPAYPVLFVNGRPRVLGHRRRPRGALDWHGRRQGRGLSAGVYRVTLGARDSAGNRSSPTRPAVVRIRYVEIPRRALQVRAGKRFALPVSTDATTLSWSFARRGRRVGRGVVGRREGAGNVVLRAPRRPGRYVVTLSAAGHAGGARLLVHRRRR